MYIIPKYKFCYLAEPRTGSKAIAKILMEKYGAVRMRSHHDTPNDHPEIDLRNWVVCAGARNHWDAMISWWFKIERRGKMTPLAKFMPRFCKNNPSFVRNGKLWWKMRPFINTLIRYEWLNADLDYALVSVGLPPCNIPIVTDSKRNGRPYQIFYKTMTRDWVANFFKEEIKQHQYKF